VDQIHSGGEGLGFRVRGAGECDVGTVDPFKSIFPFGEKSQSI